MWFLRKYIGMERKIGSAKQRRGDLKDPKIFEALFQNLEKDPKTKKWRVLPFEGVIRGDKHNSTLPHDETVRIKSFDALADYFNISTNTLTGKGGILDQYPNGVTSSTRLRGVADEHADEYLKTHCHRLLMEHYTARGTKPLEATGQAVDAMGSLLYHMFSRRDPALLRLADFQVAKADPRFFDANGEITYSNLSHIRCVIQFAAMKLEGSPIRDSHFQFSKGDEWYTAGKKNIGGKKNQYLFEEELERFIGCINEVDTLVLSRLILEGMTRLSSGVLMGRNDVDGKKYNCVLLSDPIFACTMFEPKVKKSKTGGKVTRYFTKETIAFFQRYIDDEGIVGAWFKRGKSSYAACLKAAGYRAGLWRFKTAAKGEPLEKDEQLLLSHPMSNGKFYVYKLKGKNKSSTGKRVFERSLIVEGKETTSHVVGKHTGVSLAGLHGFTLDNCAEQAGTEPSTIRDFYHGTLGVDLQKVVMGQRTFTPWNEWVHETLEKWYSNRYAELKRQGMNAAAIAETERQFAVSAAEAD
jgi:hypothetical protein